MERRLENIRRCVGQVAQAKKAQNHEEDVADNGEMLLPMPVEENSPVSAAYSRWKVCSYSSPQQPAPGDSGNQSSTAPNRSLAMSQDKSAPVSANRETWREVQDKICASCRRAGAKCHWATSPTVKVCRRCREERIACSLRSTTANPDTLPEHIVRLVPAQPDDPLKVIELASALQAQSAARDGCAMSELETRELWHSSINFESVTAHACLSLDDYIEKIERRYEVQYASDLQRDAQLDQILATNLEISYIRRAAATWSALTKC